MIKLAFKNTELRMLIAKGKSCQYGNLTNHRMVHEQIQAFCSLLDVIDNIYELDYYTFFKYIGGPEERTVIFSCQNITCKLYFTEGHDSSITITDFKTNNYNEAK